jgi:glycogen(starch) synthase
VKVLVLTNMYPPHALGGYELSCQDVVRRWRAQGHEVSVLTTMTRLPTVADADSPDVHRDLEWYWADHQVLRPSPRQRLAIERRNRRRLAELLDELRPDVVSVWAMGGMSMSLLSLCVERRQPMVLVIEDDWLVYGPRMDAWLAAWSRRPSSLGRIGATVSGVPTTPPLLPADVTVAFASDYLRRRAAADSTIGFTSSEVVALGVDTADFPVRSPEDRSWHGRLLCVGRIEPRKGFDVVIRALADLPDVTLRLVGPSDGGHLADLEALAHELGVENRLSSRPAVPRDQMAGVYAGADALVFPSRWEEPFGLVPLEAMTQATPVIATRRGGSAEFLVDGVNCLEMTNDDPASVVAAVCRLAGDPTLRKQLVCGGSETAARYDVGQFAAGLESLHLNAAGTGAR